MSRFLHLDQLRVLLLLATHAPVTHAFDSDGKPKYCFVLEVWPAVYYTT